MIVELDSRYSVRTLLLFTTKKEEDQIVHRIHNMVILDVRKVYVCTKWRQELVTSLQLCNLVALVFSKLVQLDFQNLV